VSEIDGELPGVEARAGRGPILGGELEGVHRTAGRVTAPFLHASSPSRANVRPRVGHDLRVGGPPPAGG
jgi:hypothetical protein